MNLMYFLSETTKYMFLLFSDDHWAARDINEGIDPFSYIPLETSMKVSL